MDRGRPFKEGPPAAGESNAAAKRRLRRAVMDNTRRKIERALGVADAAEELAKAAQAVLVAAEASQIDFQSMGLTALRAAVAKYHQAVDG